MTGGLIQLVAYGLQDLFLTKDPQITFFKIVYRRHTNFSTEVIPQYFSHTPDFGKRITCVLSRNGDLIGKTHLVVVLPTIPTFLNADGTVDIITKFAWVRRIGFAIIDNIEIEIGGELLDRQYGDWLNIWYELTVPLGLNQNKILGDVEVLTDFTNGKPSYKLFIPLKFWFCRFPGLALPIVALQYNHIEINLVLRELDDCYIIVPTNYIQIDNDLVNFQPFEFLRQSVNGVVSLARYIYFDIATKFLYIWRLTDNGFQSVTVTDPTLIQTQQQQKAILYAKNPDGTYVNEQYFINGLTTQFQAMPAINSAEIAFKNRNFRPSSIVLKDAFLLVEYIFLDSEERVRFAQGKHDYLIEQILYNGEKTIDGLNQSFKLGFTQPCKELHWVTQLTLAQNTRINDWFNYTDSLIKDANENPIGINLIVTESVLFNGLERISLRDYQYFNWLQPFQNHTHSPPEGVNSYSFGLFPEKHQPASVANMSKVDNVLLTINVEPIINSENTAKLRVYAMIYNILRVVNGISGLIFSNDRQN